MMNSDNKEMDFLNPRAARNLHNSFNMENQTEEMNKDLKKELEIEDNITDYLKCYFCLTKVIKPK